MAWPKGAGLASLPEGPPKLCRGQGPGPAPGDRDRETWGGVSGRPVCACRLLQVVGADSRRYEGGSPSPRPRMSTQSLLGPLCLAL